MEPLTFIALLVAGLYYALGRRSFEDAQDYYKKGTENNQHAMKILAEAKEDLKKARELREKTKKTIDQFQKVLK